MRTRRRCPVVVSRGLSFSAIRFSMMQASRVGVRLLLSKGLHYRQMLRYYRGLQLFSNSHNFSSAYTSWRDVPHSLTISSLFRVLLLHSALFSFFCAVSLNSRPFPIAKLRPSCTSSPGRARARCFRASVSQLTLHCLHRPRSFLRSRILLADRAARPHSFERSFAAHRTVFS